MLRQLRIVIVDDNDQFRGQLHRVIEHGTTYTVVGEGVDGQDAIDLAAATLPDVIVIDAQMPRVDGIEATVKIKSEHPSMFVIGIVGSPIHIPAMREAGADSCLLKTESLAVLFDILASIAQSAPPQAPPQPVVEEVRADSPPVVPVAPTLEIDAPLTLPQDDALLKLILDGVQDAIAVTELLSPESPPRTVFVNEAFSTLLGRSAKALVGKTLDFWDRAYGDPEQRRALTDRLMAGETVELDLPAGSKGKDVIHMEMRGIDTISGSYIVCLGRPGAS